LGLPVAPARPLLGIVSRLVEQKGVDLAITVIEHQLQGGGPGGELSLVALGSGDPALERALASLSGRFSDRVCVRIGYDARLSRRIFAASDLLLLPSRYEPCGIAQMMGMRYGAVPLARETGGLADTVHDPGLSETPNGFLFPEPSPRSLAFGLRRALHCYRERPDRFRTLSQRGMREDFSWGSAADRYREVYERALLHRRRQA
jgi:starch synthase